MSKNKQYAEGYQAAMIDIKRAVDEGGLDAVTLWLADNLRTDTELDDLVRQIKAYATENYEKGGWDVLIETMTDDDIKKEIGVSRSFGYVKWKIGQSLKIYDDHRKDIEATAF